MLSHYFKLCLLPKSPFLLWLHIWQTLYYPTFHSDCFRFSSVILFSALQINSCWDIHVCIHYASWWLSSVQSLSCVWFYHPLGYSTLASCSSLNRGACSNPCPSTQWCHSTILSSVIPFSIWLQSFPASGSFPMSQFFTLGGQSIWVSPSVWVLPMNSQD